MPSDEITVSAPATIANLGPGYDLMGMALDRPRDILRVELQAGGVDAITVRGLGSESLNIPAEKNACVVAGRAVLAQAGAEKYRLKMQLEKGVPPRMGMGSSGASSAAGAFAVNALLGYQLDQMHVLRCAMKGERASCGSAHADNVAPALMGGITVITGYEPLNVVKLSPIESTAVVEVSPRIELAAEKTKLAREVLPSSVPLSKVVGQMAAFSSLLLGIVQKDAALMGRGISGDGIIEPARAKLIPGFIDVKAAAMHEGAHGATISGAGPTVFALAPIERADAVGKAMVRAFTANSIKSVYAIYQCSQEGTKIV
jgi:homoserine kinase